MLQALGLEPQKVRLVALGQHLSRDDVVFAFKKRFREGKSLAETFVEREDQRLVNAARRAFGSYRMALKAAGFDPEQVRLRRPKITPDHLAELKAEMTRVASLEGHERATAARALKRRWTSTVFDHFGNWRKTCRKLGLRPDDLSTYPYPSKEYVMRALRRRAQSLKAASSSRIYEEDRSLHTAVYRFLGSWTAAKTAAGINSAPDLISRRLKRIST